MKKFKPSGPAIFMYCVIALALIISVVCFVIHYGSFFENSGILWTGVTAFTIMYHLWLRLIMGNLTKLFRNRLTYKGWWFKEKAGERGFYKLIRVKKWKSKALTYDPASFSLKDNSLEAIANTMAKSETDHWINVGISLSTMLFALMWGELWIFAVTAIAAIIFDGQFIVIQRYNRPRVVKLLKKQTV